MNADIVDGRWSALQSDSRMTGFWQILKRAGISREDGQVFLGDLWVSCAGEEDMGIDLDFFTQKKREMQLWGAISDYRRDYHTIPPWLDVTGSPEKLEDPVIRSAFSSRKRNFCLERARAAVELARVRFGRKRPLYDAVAIAVSVITKCDLDGDDLRHTCANK